MLLRYTVQTRSLPNYQTCFAQGNECKISFRLSFTQPQSHRYQSSHYVFVPLLTHFTFESYDTKSHYLSFMVYIYNLRNLSAIYSRSDILTAVNLRATLFWEVITCSIVDHTDVFLKMEAANAFETSGLTSHNKSHYILGDGNF